MFSRPPVVKSLSRYAEFDFNLKPRHFLLMLGLAACIHVMLLTFYALMPADLVTRIPVRSINIRLGDGTKGGANAREQEAGPNAPPHPLTLREITVGPTSAETSADSAAQLAFDRTLSAGLHASPSSAPHIASSVPRRKARLANPDKKEDDIPESGAAQQYVHSADASAPSAAPSAQGTGNANAARHGGGGALGGAAESAGAKQAHEEAVRRYEQTLSLWLARHKTYPEEARKRHLEGNAVVRLRINRAGDVVFAAIEHSSGNEIIDEAVLAMVHSSNPVPSVPEQYPAGREFEFLIPVSFRLN